MRENLTFSWWQLIPQYLPITLFFICSFMVMLLLMLMLMMMLMPPIHGKQIHFCVGTSHEKFSRSVGTIRTAQFFSVAQYITQGFPMPWWQPLASRCSSFVVGVDVGVDVDAGVVFHVILPAAHTAGRQVLDVSVLLHLPETWLLGSFPFAQYIT